MNQEGKWTELDTAVILCGGDSKRMGFDKQMLNISGKNITEYIADQLSKEFKNIIIVTNKPHLYKKGKWIVVEDLIDGFGPLGGIYTGLNYISTDLAYIVAGDMPVINLKFIQWMKNRIQGWKTFMDVLVTKQDNDYLEPFNGFYSKKCQSIIKEAFSKGERKLISIYSELKVQYISENEARTFSPDWEMFCNLNTVDDLDRFFLTWEKC